MDITISVWQLRVPRIPSVLREKCEKREEIECPIECPELDDLSFMAPSVLGIDPTAMMDSQCNLFRIDEETGSPPANRQM